MKFLMVLLAIFVILLRGAIQFILSVALTLLIPLLLILLFLGPLLIVAGVLEGNILLIISGIVVLFLMLGTDTL